MSAKTLSAKWDQKIKRYGTIKVFPKQKHLLLSCFQWRNQSRETSHKSHLSTLSDRVLEHHIFATKFPVDPRESFQFIFGVVPLLRIQENLMKKGDYFYEWTEMGDVVNGNDWDMLTPLWLWSHPADIWCACLQFQQGILHLPGLHHGRQWGCESEGARLLNLSLAASISSG